jgi:hypothetical protein
LQHFILVDHKDPFCYNIDIVMNKESKMQERELDTPNAGFYAYAAARDAAQRSYAASTHYTEQQKTRAERVKLALELMYSARAVHLNYRKGFVAIKLDSPRVVDRANLDQMEKEWSAAGIAKVITAQGIIYRIPKK